MFGDRFQGPNAHHSNFAQNLLAPPLSTSQTPNAQHSGLKLYDIFCCLPTSASCHPIVLIFPCFSKNLNLKFFISIYFIIFHYISPFFESHGASAHEWRSGLRRTRHASHRPRGTRPARRWRLAANRTQREDRRRKGTKKMNINKEFYWWFFLF